MRVLGDLSNLTSVVLCLHWQIIGFRATTPLQITQTDLELARKLALRHSAQSEPENFSLSGECSELLGTRAQNVKDCEMGQGGTSDLVKGGHPISVVALRDLFPI